MVVYRGFTVHLIHSGLEKSLNLTFVLENSLNIHIEIYPGIFLENYKILLESFYEVLENDVTNIL